MDDESQSYGFGGSGSDKEPTTPISRFGSQISPHSTQPGIENINLDDDNSGAKQKNVHRNKGKVMWSTEEEKCLARAWGTTTNDPKVENAQKSKHLWQSTATYYNDNRPVGTPMREWSLIKSHYYRVMPDVDKFSGWYNNFLNNRASGQSDANVLAAPHDMWKMSNKNNAFKYEHVWKIVMECEKWAP
ncbi:glutathione S-transferase T3-like [Henckelia pumila]|uniref:glutathione S-transferase T3-like n=1 Tax=Henckelia pumila TaxID=405737 RepID=UPI003C6E8149